MKIAGIVLAGGQSSRYGQPKMFEMFAGQPLYKHSLIALQKNQLDRSSYYRYKCALTISVWTGKCPMGH